MADAAADSATAPAANSAAVTVPMLRSMNKCRDVQFVLMKLLSLKELAALDSTCRSWRQWLLHPPLISGLHFEQTAPFTVITPLASCEWARQLVTTVFLLTWCRDDSKSHSLLTHIIPFEVELAVCSRLFSALPRFTRLHTLKLVMCDAFAATPLWPTLFAALSDSLRELHLMLHDEQPADSANAALAHISHLRRLTTLVMFVGACQTMKHVDLSQLPSLPCLHKFKLVMQRESNDPRARCTPMQVQHLAQCSQLTNLDCGGVWSSHVSEFEDQGWGDLSKAQRIRQGIAALVRGLTLQPAAASASGASESVSSVALSTNSTVPCRLQYLNLLGTLMSADVWRHVSQLTSLTELEPPYWSNDMTPRLWARLAHFTRLEKIFIGPPVIFDSSKAPLRTEHFLPHLLQCTQLRTVRIVGKSCTWTLSAAQLDGIARLPLLHTLCLQSVELESVEPLARATKLRSLWLSLCSGPPSDADFRRSLPPLPALTELSIAGGRRTTAAQAAPLKAALFARMPKLTRAMFKQQLLFSF
jgi:hypothetical protein